MRKILEDQISNRHTEDGNNSHRRSRPKRKFPGPAGILPDLDSTDVKSLNASTSRVAHRVSEIISSATKSRKQNNYSQLPSSQGETEQVLLGKVPWSELLRFLKLNADDKECPTQYMNIGWILKSACQLPVGAKVPFLATVVVESPELPGSKPDEEKPSRIKLLDSTGTIEAAMDPAFVKLYSKDLVPGTALAITNAAILQFKRRVVLTVTRKNILCMAAEVDEDSTNEDDDHKKNMSRCAVSFTERGVKLREFNKFEPLSVMQAFKNISDPGVFRQDSIKHRSINIQNNQISLFTTVDHAFDEGDDDLFFGFDTETFDEVFGSQNERSSDGEKTSAEIEMKNNSCISENQCESDRVDCQLTDDFEDEFDRELASLDETAVGTDAESQLDSSNPERCVVDSGNHVNSVNEFQKLGAPHGVQLESSENSLPTQTALARLNDDRQVLSSQSSSQSRSTWNDIFESSQPAEELEAPAPGESPNRDESDNNCEKFSHDEDDDKFYDEFDDELDLLCK